MLEKRLARLETAFDTNTGVFSDGMKMLEIQHAVHRAVMNDLLHGRVRVLANGKVLGDIDFNAYLKEQIEALTKAEEVPEAKKEEPLITAPDEGTIVQEFGGDA